MGKEAFTGYDVIAMKKKPFRMAVESPKFMSW